MVWLLTSQWMKNWLLHKWLVYLNFDIFTAAIYCCPKNCKPRKTIYLLWKVNPSELAFYGSGIARLPNCLAMMNADWLDTIQSKVFLQMKFIILKSSPTKQTVFLPGQPAPYNQLLMEPHLFVPECYFV